MPVVDLGVVVNKLLVCSVEKANEVNYMLRTGIVEQKYSVIHKAQHLIDHLETVIFALHIVSRASQVSPNTSSMVQDAFLDVL